MNNLYPCILYVLWFRRNPTLGLRLHFSFEWLGVSQLIHQAQQGMKKRGIVKPVQLASYRGLQSRTELYFVYIIILYGEDFNPRTQLYPEVLLVGAICYFLDFLSLEGNLSFLCVQYLLHLLVYYSSCSYSLVPDIVEVTLEGFECANTTGSKTRGYHKCVDLWGNSSLFASF